MNQPQTDLFDPCVSVFAWYDRDQQRVRAHWYNGTTVDPSRSYEIDFGPFDPIHEIAAELAHVLVNEVLHFPTCD